MSFVPAVLRADEETLDGIKRTGSSRSETICACRSKRWGASEKWTRATGWPNRFFERQGAASTGWISLSFRYKVNVLIFINVHGQASRHSATQPQNVFRTPKWPAFSTQVTSYHLSFLLLHLLVRDIFPSKFLTISL